MRRAHRKQESGPRPLVGAIAVGVLLLLTVLVFGGVFERLLQQKGEDVGAVFRDATQLSARSPVRVHGVDQGRVSDVVLNPGGRTATVKMEIFGSALPLYRDAHATVKMRNALGGNYYVDLSRGTPAAGRLEGDIPIEHTENAVEVDTLLSNLREGERNGLKTMLSEVPTALEDEHALPTALNAVSEAAPGLRSGLSAVRGERDGDLRTLVRNTARVTTALSPDADSLTDLIEGGAVVTETVARRKAEVQDAIQRAAAVLPAVDTTMTHLDATLRNADPLLATLRRPVGQVAPTLRDLRPTVIEVSRLLRAAQPLLGKLRPAAASLASAAREGNPLLEELRPSIGRLAQTILPDLNKVDKTSRRTTAAMVGPTVAGLGAAAGQYDNLSHMVGLAAGGGERAIDTSPCRTYFLDPDSVNAGRVLECKQIAQTINDLLSYNPIPPQTP